MRWFWHNEEAGYMARAMAQGSSGKSSPLSGTSKAATEKLPRRPGISQKRLRQGARNAALCMAVHAGDRVFIITDDERMDIAPLVEEACREAGASAVVLHRIEEY